MPLAANVLVGTTGADHIAPLGNEAQATFIAVVDRRVERARLPLRGRHRRGTGDGCRRDQGVAVRGHRPPGAYRFGSPVDIHLCRNPAGCDVQLLSRLGPHRRGGPTGRIQARDQAAGDRPGRTRVRRERRGHDPTHCRPAGRARPPRRGRWSTGRPVATSSRSAAEPDSTGINAIRYHNPQLA